MARTTKKWVGQCRDSGETIPIHFFLRAPFNAAVITQGVALSVDKILTEELDRILVHELTHWLSRLVWPRLSLRPIFTLLLNEGMACYASQEILGFSDETALFMSKECLDFCVENERLLKETFNDWISGNLLEIRQGRHEVVYKKKLIPPFRDSDKHQEWNRYGYYLGLRFIQRLAQRGPREKICQWILRQNPYELEKSITTFLNECGENET